MSEIRTLTMMLDPLVISCMQLWNWFAWFVGVYTHVGKYCGFHGRWGQRAY